MTITCADGCVGCETGDPEKQKCLSNPPASFLGTPEWLEEMSERFENILVMDGFDDCIMGVCVRFGSSPFIVYDHTKVIEKLVSQGMSYEEAVEFHDYNQAGAYVGNHTPGFIVTE